MEFRLVAKKLGRGLGKLLKVLFWTTLGTAFVAIGLALVILRWPSVILNAKTLNWGGEFARKKGLDIHWTDADLHAISRSWLKKRIELRFEGVCGSLPGDSKLPGAPPKLVDFCASHLAAAVEADFSQLPPKLVEVGPLSLREGVVHYWEEASAPAAPKDPNRPASNGTPIWLSMLEQAKLQPIDLELKSWELVGSDKNLSGSLVLKNDAADQGLLWRILATEKWDPRTTAGRAMEHEAKLEATVASRDGKWKGPWNLDADLKGAFKDGRKVSLAAKIDQLNTMDFAYRLNARYQQGRKKLAAQLGGNVGGAEIRADITAQADGWVPHAHRIRVRDCSLDLKRVGNAIHNGHFDLKCPVAVQLDLPPIKAVPEFKMPTETKALLTADVATSFPPAADRSIEGRVALDMEPILAPVFTGVAKVASQISGVPADFPEKWKLDTTIDSRLSVPVFQKLVEMLRKSAWPVPAPLNVLKGNLEVAVNGRADLAGGSLPVKFTTRLLSDHQNLNLDGNGKFAFARTDAGMTTDFTMDLVLSKIALALPRLELGALPRFLPDKRIHDLILADLKANHVIDSNSGDSSNFTYHLRVRTPDQLPITIASNLIPDPVPIQMNIGLDSGGPLVGEIKVIDYPFEVFRRKATLEHFYVRYTPDNSVEGQVDGSVKVVYTDYTVRVLIFGTVSKPQIKLVSDPPVPEDKLLSVLLFGRTMGELDPDQTDSVGNAKAAIADQALGLASMYALASTPVESVGYDPSSQVITAKVKLGNGTSLDLGAGSGTGAGNVKQQLGITRRLSRFWSFTTGVANPSDPTTRSASALLQWRNRY